VTSRVPLWDLTARQLTRDVPHTQAGDSLVDVEVGGKHQASGHGLPAASQPRQSAEAGVHIEHPTGQSAKELGIPMPNPTIKPLICALGMTIMFTGLLFIHKGNMPLALATMIGGALVMTMALYAWVLTPLEDAH
jgi:hypothetical protein